MMTRHKLDCWILIGLVVLGSSLLYRAAPFAAKHATWTHTVLRNWTDYGLFKLGGKVVYNTAGFEAIEKPISYGGHQPFVFYAAYAIKRIFGGEELSGLIFHLLLSLVVAGGIWRLLGKSRLGILVACAAVWSPGYMRWVMILDPVTIPVLLGLFVLAWVPRWLQAEHLGLGRGVALFLLLFLYAFLNWSTAFALTITGSYLMVALWKRPQRWLLFGVASGMAVLAVGLIAIVQKDPGAGGSGSSFRFFYDNYLIGAGGYQGHPMTWMKAITRIGAVTLIGLLPLLAVFCWHHYRALKSSGRIGWASWVPLLVSVASVLGMRNYFAHHPWMAGPIVIFGIVFSMRLLQDLAKPEPEPLPESTEKPLRFPTAIALVCFLGYGLLVIGFLRHNSAAEGSLVRVVREHVPRQAVLVYVPQEETQLDQDRKRISEMFDRRLLPTTELGNVTNSAGKVAVYQLTSRPLNPNQHPIAKTEPDNTPGQRAMAAALDWYRTHIAQRRQGERIEVAPTYYLLPGGQ